LSTLQRFFKDTNSFYFRLRLILKNSDVIAVILTLLLFIFYFWIKFGIYKYNILYTSYGSNWVYYLNDCSILDKLKNNIAILPLYVYLSIIGTFLFYYYDFVISFLMYSNYSCDYFNSFNQLSLTKNTWTLNELLFIPAADNLVHFLDLTHYNNISHNAIKFDLNIEFINSYPLFIYFGFLFIFSTIISLFCLSYLGLYGVFIINLITIVLFWLSTLYYFDLIISNNIFYYINLGKWMYLSSGYRISFDLLIDIVSISFSFLTLSIGVFVYIYTFSYFRYEPLVERLLLFLNAFMISMILLVSSGNFIVMFLGWELIGLTSFFLINFWSTRVGTFKAAFKAFSFNKVSDLFLFFGILLIFSTMFNLDIMSFNNQIHLYEAYNIEIFYFSLNLIEVISFFFIGCAFIKSAQIGAHIWLPDSMEAPVPASALIHSATLVSAGIYLLLRLTPLFELSLYAYYIIPLVGAVTALYGGLVSAFQSDTKKTLAYSTISHCGFLMLAYATGSLEFVILYLYVHGFFKAATFLCMGNVNRFNRNIQDFKRMGGFYKYLPFECLASFICLLNLSGLPLSLGFYSKHLLFIGLNDLYAFYYILLSFIVLAAVMGVFYSYRLFYSIFFDVKKGKKTIYLNSNRLVLNSKFYSNTSLASNFAISILILVSYIVILYLFNATLNKFYSISDLKSISNNNSYSYLLQPDLNFLNTSSVLNWLVIVLIIVAIFVNWRQSYNYTYSIDQLNKFILFSFFFFFISKYIL